MTWAPRCHYTNGIVITVIKQIDRDYPEEFMFVARKKIEGERESSLAHYFWKRIKGKIKRMPSSSSTKVIIIVSLGSHFPQATVPIGRFILLGVGNPFSSSFPPPYCSISLIFSARTLKESHITKGTLLLHLAYMHLLVSKICMHAYI